MHLMDIKNLEHKKWNNDRVTDGVKIDFGHESVEML